MTPPIKFKDPELDIREQWKKFARYLYSNVLKIEKNTEREFINSRKIGIPFIERKSLANKILKCEETKKKLEQSVKKRPYDLCEEDYEIINEKGFEYFFKYYDGFMLSYPQVAIDKDIVKV